MHGQQALYLLPTLHGWNVSASYVTWTLHGWNVSASYVTWMERFMRYGCKYNHEAFLSAWLSKYAFVQNFSQNFISAHVFTIAIRLARGNPIALAPAVLSRIYRELRLLKEKFVAITSRLKLNTNCYIKEDLILNAPFHLVQLWAWERFPLLQPSPNEIQHGEPRPARWQNLKRKLNCEGTGLILDSAEEKFRWRPYSIAVKNWLFPKIYGDNEQSILVNTDLSEEVESFARCLRASELVGLGCIEQYLPHRVAMQFGMDQDLPGFVARCNKSPDTAWGNYDRPIRDEKLYIPPRLFEGDVTLWYLNWWKQSISDPNNATRTNTEQPRNCNDHVPVLPFSASICTPSDTGVSVGNEHLLLGSVNEHGNNRMILDVVDEPFSGSQHHRTPTPMTDATGTYSEQTINCSNNVPVLPFSPSICTQSETAECTMGNNQVPLGSVNEHDNTGMINDVVNEPLSASHHQRTPTPASDATEAYSEQPSNGNDNSTVFPSSPLKYTQSETGDCTMGKKQVLLGSVNENDNTRKVLIVIDEPMSGHQHHRTPTTDDVDFSKPNQGAELLEAKAVGNEQVIRCQHQCTSGSTKGSEDVKKTKSATNPGADVMQSDSSLLEKKEDVAETIACREDIRSGEGNSRNSRLAKLKSDLEVRVSRLEKEIAELKARRLVGNAGDKK